MSKILIIEDEPALRSLFSHVLQRAGYEVVDAANGAEGLHQAQIQLPDLVLTDVVMPDKEGLETIIELRQGNPNLPIIAMSGAGASSHYLKMATGLGAQRALAKPFTMPSLVRTVSEVLRGIPEAPAESAAPSRPPAFLVLDDDQDNRFLNKRILEKSFPGCAVWECATVNEAVDHCAAQPVDAILADHHLKGASGVTLVWRLRRLTVTCPILMVTSNTDEAIKQQAYVAGVTEVFSAGQGDYVPYLRALVGQGAPAGVSQPA